MDYAILKEALRLLRASTPLVLTTIVDRSGSSPQTVGSSMLVGAQGRFAGTVGGGKIEYLSILHAQELLPHQESDQVKYDLTMSEASNTGMACGGKNDMHFCYLDPQDTQLLEVLERACALEGSKEAQDLQMAGKPLHVVMALSADNQWGLSLLLGDGCLGPACQMKEDMPQAFKKLQAHAAKNHDVWFSHCEVELDSGAAATEAASAAESGRASAPAGTAGAASTAAEPAGTAQSGVQRGTRGTETFFFASLRPHTRCLLFGGGHVSQALSYVLAPLAFEVHVYEDREEFTNPDLFAPGTHTHLSDLKHLLDVVKPTVSDYLCIQTRGHAFDTQIIALFLREPHAYMGCIGSKHKAAAVRKSLAEQGFTQEEIDSVYLPIGLGFGNHTPAEIAISIVAQLLQFKTHGTCDARTR